MKETTILIPTYNRLNALTATLTSLLFQEYTDFDLMISDQSLQPTYEHETIQAVLRILKERDVGIQTHHHPQNKGIAEHRQFLLEKAETPYVLFLDDDVVLESYVIRNLSSTIKQYACGFVGAAVIGLEGKKILPDDLDVEFWDEGVKPETITPDSPEWDRAALHFAAHPAYFAKRYHLTPDNPKPYKIAWVGACTLYDRSNLQEVGGFSFWKNLPKKHVGEDVLVQLRLMEKYGGCAILPSGAYHLELPTTLPERKFNIPEQV